MTLSIDVLPAPLRPTRPTLSPGWRENEARESVIRPPTSTSRSRTWSMRRPLSRPGGGFDLSFGRVPLVGVGGAVARTAGGRPLSHEVEELLTEGVFALQRQRAAPDRPVHRRKLGGTREVLLAEMASTVTAQVRAEPALGPRELLVRRRSVDLTQRWHDAVAHPTAQLFVVHRRI